MTKKTKTKKTRAKKTTKVAPKTRTKIQPRSKKRAAASPMDSSIRGAVVGGTDPCACGHAPEEHGRDPDYPGSTSCVVCEEGDCVAYEVGPGSIK